MQVILWRSSEMLIDDSRAVAVTSMRTTHHDNIPLKRMLEIILKVIVINSESLIRSRLIPWIGLDT